jgi:hypothetical protein
VSEGGIWSTGADVSDRQLLVAASRGEGLSEPVWSPDGTALAYARAFDEGQIMLRAAPRRAALLRPVPLQLVRAVNRRIVMRQPVGTAMMRSTTAPLIPGSR